MSLINDALKRAKQAQQRNEPPAVGAPLRPVEGRARAGSRPASLLPLVLAVALVLGGGVLIVIAISTKSSKSAPATTPMATATSPVAKAQPSPVAPTPTPAVAPVNPSSVPKSAPTPSPAVAPGVVLSPATIQTQSVAVTPPTNAAVPDAPPAPPPVPKLQGIFYNPSRPSAVLSGKTVFAGGRVGEFTVLTITARSVTVTRAGQTNVLSMEE